jgi:hypothetical protein
MLDGNGSPWPGAAGDPIGSKESDGRQQALMLGTHDGKGLAILSRRGQRVLHWK